MSDDTEKLEIVAEEGSDDILEFDGMLNMNAPRFRKTKTVEVMMALDPDNENDDDDNNDDPNATPVLHEDGDGINADYDAVEPDVADAATLGDQPTAAEEKEIVTDGRAPPTGWRRDDFPLSGPVRRTVWTPPWSLRPPT